MTPEVIQAFGQYIVIPTLLFLFGLVVMYVFHKEGLRIEYPKLPDYKVPKQTEWKTK